MVNFKKLLVIPVYILSNTSPASSAAVESNKKYISALYFSEWSYPNHIPSDIPLSRITNIFYGFADIDTENYNIQFANQSLALTDPIEFHQYSLSTDDEDLQYKNISLNVNAAFYEKVPWIGEYQRNVQKNIKTELMSKSRGMIEQLRQLRTINPRLKISLSVGGSDSLKKFRIVTAYKKKLKLFAANIVANVNHFGFDGVDIDWEFPKTPQDTKSLTKLLQSIREEFDKIDSDSDSKKLLTLAIPLDVEVLRRFHFDAFDKYVDYYNLMGYDITGKWSSKSGFQSQLYVDKNLIGDAISVDHSVKYLGEKINKSKIVLGMPAYGTTFNTRELYEKFDGCAKVAMSEYDQDDYHEDCNIDYNMLPPPGYTEISDTEIGAAYAFSGPSVKNQGLIVYDTPKIARLKARYVINNGLAGGFWWDSKGDTLLHDTSRSLVYNFVDELGGIYMLDDTYSENLSGNEGHDVIVSDYAFAQKNTATSTSRKYIILHLFLFHCFVIFI